MLPRRAHPGVIIAGSFAIFAAGYGLAVFTLPGRFADAISGRSGVEPPAITAQPPPEQPPAAEANSSRVTDALIASMKYAIADPSSTNRAGKMWLLSQQITRENAQAVADTLLAGPLSTREHLTPVLEAWAQFDPLAAISFAGKLKGREHRWAEDSVVGSWALKDFAAASAWARALPPGNEKNWAEHRLFETQARQDPDALLQTIVTDRKNARKYGDVRREALLSIGQDWARSDPQAAIRWTSENLPADLQALALGNIAGVWAQTDPSAASQWAQQLPADQRAGAVAYIAGQWGRDDPAAASKWVSQIPDEATRAQAMACVAEAWVSTDPAGASQWIGRMSEGKARTGAMSGLMESWIARDPDKAEAWFESLPAFKDRDQAIHGFIGALTSKSPPLALRLTETVGDQTRKSSCLEQIAGFWLQRDPAAARQWIGNSALPADVKQKLLSQPKR